MAEEFSIVVPVYNRASLICRCLDSIKAQTYRPLHLVVVDNASTDETLRTVTQWGQENAGGQLRMSILEERQRGAAAARNCGLRAVTSDRLCFFDSDDAMRPDLAETAMRTFAGNPDADIVLWQSRLNTLRGFSCQLKWASSNYMDNHIVHSVLRTQGYAVRRKFFNDAGAWNPAMLVWDDWELGVRLLLGNPRIVPVAKVLADVYAQEQSITGTSFSPKAGEWELALKRASECIADSSHPHTRHLLNMVDYRRVILAAHYRREGNAAAAQTLLSHTYANTLATPFQRFILTLCYRYTSLGGRGASYFASPLL